MRHGGRSANFRRKGVVENLKSAKDFCVFTSFLFAPIESSIFESAIHHPETAIGPRNKTGTNFCAMIGDRKKGRWFFVKMQKSQYVLFTRMPACDPWASLRAQICAESMVIFYDR